MFKIGDKVKCIKELPKYKEFQVGKTYEVREFERYGNHKGWNSVVEGDFWIIVNHYNIKDCFELVTEGNKMSKVNYHLLSDSVVINHNAKTTIIHKGDIRFEKVVQCIRDKKLQDISDLIDTEKVFSLKGLTLKDGALFMSGEALPETLSRRVLDLVENNLPIDIMVNFWNNLKANPSFNSRKMLYAFLENNGHPLTEDGCFIAYRGVTDDFKDVHTRTFDNSVGKVCEINRNLVDDNPNNLCSTGLHVACHSYAKDFGSKLIEVKINPKDVVAVPTDYNGTKMRVCKFEVMAVCENLLSGPVYKPTTHNLRDENGRFKARE